MITNTYIPLSRDSQMRTDALNTIKYTLMLDYKIPEVHHGNISISDIMENCQNCCDGLFKGDYDFRDSFNFFGTFLSSYKAHSLFYLNEHLAPSSKVISIPSMILHHCILSSYHAILTELLQDNWVNAYTMENKIKTNGFQSLDKNGIISFKDGKILVERQLEDTDSSKKPSKKSSKASDFGRIAGTHKNIDLLSNAMELMITTESKDSSSYRYNLQFSELCYSICKGTRATDWKKIKKIELKGSEDIKEIVQQIAQKKINVKLQLEYIKKLTESMEPHDASFSKKRFKGNSADTLYHYYLTERIFNFSLLFSLLENIRQIEYRTSYQLCQEYIIPILCNCKDLPNIFSRQIFLKYAFQQIESKPESFDDFWFRNDYDRRHILGEFSKHPHGFQFPRWIEQYKLFFKYISKYVIPVYEWCFINMLMESVEQKTPNETHFEHLRKALELLEDYMNKNYQAIIHPLSSEKDVLDMINHNYYLFLKGFSKDKIKRIIQNKNDVLDIITKNDVWLEDLPKKYIELIIQHFLFPSGDLELNLPPLNPDFFKYSKDVNPKTKFDDIRKFYLNLVRHNYLE